MIWVFEKVSGVVIAVSGNERSSARRCFFAFALHPT